MNFGRHMELKVYDRLFTFCFVIKGVTFYISLKDARLLPKSLKCVS